jgi:hypothetical protein
MAQEPAHYLRQIRRQMYKSISAVLREVDPNLAPPTTIDPVVGQVQDFASLVQLAQREGVPIWDCSSTYTDLRQKAKQSFKEIAEYVVANATV